MGEVQVGTSIRATHQEVHDAFNRRDWESARDQMAPDVVYTDHARGVTVRGPDEVIETVLRPWADAFTDGEIEDLVFHEVDTVSVSQFIGRGSQDGQFGPFAPSGRFAETTFCEIVRSGEDGLIVAGDIYYDQLSMLMQLGHLPAPDA